MEHDQIVIRDSIIFAVGLLFVAAGIAGALRLVAGLSWWSAAPVGIALWGTAATLLYRRTQRKLDELAEGTPP